MHSGAPHFKDACFQKWAEKFLLRWCLHWKFCVEMSPLLVKDKLQDEDSHLTHSLFIILPLWESLFLGRQGAIMCKALYLPIHLLWLLFSEQNWCEFFGDWKDPPINFCNKKLRYSWEGLYPIAQLNSKALTLSSTKYHENRTQLVEGHQS